MEPKLERIKGGWAARAERWAVHGETKQDAIRLFREAEQRHKVIDARPSPEKQTE
jgi:hypothetical protein